MKKNIKFKIGFILIALLTITVSCNKAKSKNCSSITFSNCILEAPSELYVKLELSKNPTNIPIKVQFYKGNFDDGELYDEFETTEEVEYFIMPVKQRYSAGAWYVDGNDTIVVIDGGKLNNATCRVDDYECYDEDRELILNLKLKK